MVDEALSKYRKSAERYQLATLLLVLAIVAYSVYAIEFRPEQRAEDFWTALKSIGGPDGWEGGEAPYYDGATSGFGRYTTGSGDTDDYMDALASWLDVLGVQEFESGQEVFDTCYNGGETVIGLYCRYRFGPEGYYGWVQLYMESWSPGGVTYGVQYQLWRI